MIDAIGTVLFWIAAAAGALVTIWIAAMLLFAICAIPAAMVREVRDHIRELRA